MKIINQNMGWCRLAYEVMRDKELTDKDVLLYSVLLDCCSDELVCTVGKSELISLSGGRISENTLFRSLARLEQCGYIERSGTVGEKNTYKLADVIGLKRNRKPAQKVPAEQSEPEQQELKLKYGNFQTVALTVEQFDKLVTDFGEAKTLEYIRKLDEYAHEHGKQYSDCEFTIRKWIAEDAKKPKPTYRRNGKPVHDIIHEQEMEEISKYLELVD